MSRVGRKPISIPEGVKVVIKEDLIVVEGPKGKLSRKLLLPLVKVKIADNQISVERAADTKRHRSLHGLTRTLVANMVEGVTVGFRKTLEIHGVGYRAEVKEKGVVLQIGLSHPVNFDLPEGIEAEAKREGQVTTVGVRGIDKELVGQVAARFRALYPPDPYKGKGIRYQGETVRRKAGKAAAA